MVKKTECAHPGLRDAPRKKTELAALGFNQTQCPSPPPFPDPNKAFRVGFFRLSPKPKPPPPFPDPNKAFRVGFFSIKPKAQAPPPPPVPDPNKAFRVVFDQTQSPSPPSPHELCRFLLWFPDPTRAFKAPSRSKPQTLISSNHGLCLETYYKPRPKTEAVSLVPVTVSF